MVVSFFAAFFVIIFIIVLVKRKWLWKGKNIFTKKYSKRFHLTNAEEEELIKKTERDFPNLVNAKYDAIVIGSGLSGLSTAALLAKGDGKKVLVVEQHPDVIGGCTHCFNEGGFEFDSGVHFLGNIKEQNDGLFQSISDFVSDGECKFGYTLGSAEIIHDEKTGKKYQLPTSLEDMKTYLTKEFPKEKEGIKKYFEILKEADEGLGFYCIIKSLPKFVQEIIKLIPVFKKTKKYIDLTVADVFSSCFKSTIIKTLLYDNVTYGEPQAELPFIYYVATKSHLEIRSFITGGSTMFAKKIGKVITKYGGHCICNAKVANIIVSRKGNKAIGVELESGTRIFAKQIVSTAGLKTTYQRLLPKKGQIYCKKKSKIMKLVRNLEETDSVALLYLGFKGKPEEIGLPKLEQFCLHLDVNNEQRQKDFKEMTKFSKKTYQKGWGDVSFSSSCYIKKDYQERSPNKCAMIGFLRISPSWFKKWKNSKVKQRGNEYIELKKEMEKYALDTLFKHHPQLEEKLEYANLSTCLTMSHYLGSANGGICGSKITTERLTDLNLEISPIKNLYLSGCDTFMPGITPQWVAAAYTVTKMTGNNLLLQITLANLFKEKKDLKTELLKKERMSRAL